MGPLHWESEMKATSLAAWRIRYPRAGWKAAVALVMWCLFIGSVGEYLADRHHAEVALAAVVSADPAHLDAFDAD